MFAISAFNFGSKVLAWVATGEKMSFYFERIQRKKLLNSRTDLMLLKTGRNNNYC